MAKYKLQVKIDFTDIKTGGVVRNGTIFETDDKIRALNIIRQKLGDLVAIEHQKRGKRIMFHQTFCYTIGGIETANRHIAKAFADKNILFCFTTPDLYQMLELGETCDVIVDDGLRRYEADVLILTNYDSAPHIINRVTTRKVYQQIHADFDGLTQMPMWSNFRWIPHDKINMVLAVSETAQKGLKKAFDVDSIVVPNILTPPEKKRLVFLVLSRASAEKGIERLVELVHRMDAAGKDFVVYICSTTKQLKDPTILNHRRIVLVEPSLYNNVLLDCADYLVQLSDNESYCYSVREALQRQVPVIVSNIPEFRKLVEPGKNGYILDNDFTNLNIDKIFKHVPKPEPYKEQVPAIWNKVLKGEI